MDQEKIPKAKRSGSVLFFIIFAVLLVVFAVSFWYVVSYFLDSRQQESRYDELAAMVEAAKDASSDSTVSTASPESPPPENIDPAGDISAEEPEETAALILPEYMPLYILNPDTVGWIQIEDTRINYPVMQTPDEPDYYLHRNFDREDNARGCIYVKEECDLIRPSDNITLYGHNMNDGSMFAGLHSYLSKGFWDEHRYIRFDTLTERHTYEIFAVFRTTATIGKGFGYHNFIDADDEEEYDEFISKCLELAIFDTGIVPEYGDKIICLSTCEYTQINGRLVVAAVRIE